MLAWQCRLPCEEDMWDMHSRDRYWPVACLVVVILLPIFPVMFAINYELTGISIQQMVSAVDWSSMDTCGQIYLVVGYLALIVALARYGVQARQREQRRARAVAGDESAMQVVNWPRDLSAEEAAGTIGDQPLTLRWASNSTITATAQGLLWRRPKKRDVLLAWKDARLLERWEYRGQFARKNEPINQYGYCLYASASKFVEWTDVPESQVSHERLTWKQKERLQVDLLAIVRAHTGLPLHVIGTDRGVAGQNQKENRRFLFGISLTGLAILFVLVCIPLTTGALAIIAPLTRSFALNLYVAIINGGVGLLLLGFALKAMFESVRHDTSTLSPPIVDLPAVSPALLHDASVAIRFGEHMRDRVITTLLMVVGLISTIYIAVRALQDFPESVTKHLSFSNLHTFALNMFILCAFFGIVILSIAAFSRSTTLSVENEGLFWGKGQKKQTISWFDVAVMIASVSLPSELQSFTLVEAPPHSKTISWPADAKWVRLPEGMSHDNAGVQFAAIVAQRSGVQPTVKWE